MQTVTTIGLDIAKSVFQVHGVDAGGQVVTRIDPDYPGFSPAKTDGIGRVELPRHGWLHIGWCWNVHRHRPDQLSSGNYAASPSMRLSSFS
jgi:hypothetical protein